MGKSWRRERTDHGQRNREQRRNPGNRVPLDLSSLDDCIQGQGEAPHYEDLDYSDSYVYPEPEHA